MNKVNYVVAVKTIHGAEFEFNDAYSEAGKSAMRSIENHTQIDAIGLLVGGDRARYIIPYDAIDEATITFATSPATVPADANCGEEEEEPVSTGLKISNNVGESIELTIQLTDTSINGPYGDATFTDGEATITINDGYTANISIPSGLEFTITYIGEGVVRFEPLNSNHGTTPASTEVTLAPY